jgi:hypothetical protein
MTYKLINKNTNTMMRGTIKSREAARMRKRSQKNPMNWVIVALDGSTELRYVR